MLGVCGSSVFFRLDQTKPSAYAVSMSSNSYTAVQVAVALTQAGGIVAEAARILGCTRKTVHNWIKRDPEVAEARDQARESVVDRAEQILRKKALDEEDRTSLIYLLRTMGRDRGFGDRIEHTSDDKTIEVVIAG